MNGLLKNRGTFTEDETRVYIAEIVVAIQYLHQIGIIHRDLKPLNILTDSHGHIAVSDFGLRREFIHRKKARLSYAVCGTLPYMAPELIKGKRYSTEVDWWSTGIIVYEFLTGQNPFLYTGNFSAFWLRSKCMLSTTVCGMQIYLHEATMQW
jgi:serine/threonine protein kinase